MNKIVDGFLVAPFLVAFGAGGFFAMTGEINVHWGLWVLVLVAAGCTMVSRRVVRAVRAAAIFAFGFAYAAIYTAILATPQMARNLHDVEISGAVVRTDYTPDKTRVYVKIPAGQVNAGNGMATVRINLSDGDMPRPGDEFSGTVNLYRPNAPDAPGAFDYARWAYFNGLTATGYATDYKTVARSSQGGIARVRDYIHRAADSFLADALVLGYKSALPRDVAAVWTRAGVGHIWSISGFHMTLVGGWLVALFYLLFRCVPYVTRRVPARIPATICAWVMLGAYLAISGASVATIRAFVMISLLFLAFVVGRGAISLRNVAIAFWVIFLVNPHHVMQAGFQLSFAAILGLVWFWGDAWMPRNKLLRVIYAAVMTSIIATLFTAPFISVHFGEMATYGLVGNLVILPIFSIAIMPLTFIGTVAAMFGFHAPLALASRGYDFAFQVAQYISQMPAAAISVGNVSNAAMCVMILGLAMLIVGRVRAKFAVAVPAIVIGIVMCVAAPRPTVFVTQDHELIGFRQNDELRFNKSRASKHFFAFSTWKQMSRIDAGTPNNRYKCVGGVCMFSGKNFKLAYVQKFVPLMENINDLCADDDLDYIVSYFKIDAPNCHAKILDGGFVMYDSGRIKYNITRRRWHTAPR